MIYLHMDKKYRCDQWYKRFEFLFAHKRIPYQRIDLLRTHCGKLRPNDSDALMGRFGHHRKDLRRIRPLYADLVEMFRGRVFPEAGTYYYYDDKRRQLQLCAANNYPVPRSAFVEARVQVERFLEETGLDYPLVSKRLHGASSSHVILARNAKEVQLPGVVQEYCRHNNGDVRVVVIGDRVMGFFRRNRPGDFRASGSGLVEYVDKLPWGCVAIAYAISRDNGFESMAYDFIRNNHGQWVVLEFSYCYVDTCVRNCRYYYQMPGGERKDKTGAYPEDFILEDFLHKHPRVAADALQNETLHRQRLTSTVLCERS